jgi:hypothetical protein
MYSIMHKLSTVDGLWSALGGTEMKAFTNAEKAEFAVEHHDLDNLSKAAQEKRLRLERHPPPLSVWFKVKFWVRVHVLLLPWAATCWYVFVEETLEANLSWWALQGMFSSLVEWTGFGVGLALAQVALAAVCLFCHVALSYWCRAHDTERTELPAVTGPHGVGVRDVELPDAGFRVLYPARANFRFARDASFPYVHHADEKLPAMRHALGVPCGARFVVGDWARVRLPLAEDVPPLVAAGGLPTIVFSHAERGSRELYSALGAELASHGYVVAVLEHRDGSAALARLGDSWLRYAPGAPLSALGMLSAASCAATELARLEQRVTQCERRAAEMVVCAAALCAPAAHPQLRWLHGHVDASRIFAAGHALGGVAALAAVLAASEGGLARSWRPLPQHGESTSARKLSLGDRANVMRLGGGERPRGSESDEDAFTEDDMSSRADGSLPPSPDSSLEKSVERQQGHAKEGGAAGSGYFGGGPTSQCERDGGNGGSYFLGQGSKADDDEDDEDGVSPRDRLSMMMAEDGDDARSSTVYSEDRLSSTLNSSRNASLNATPRSSEVHGTSPLGSFKSAPSKLGRTVGAAAGEGGGAEHEAQVEAVVRQRGAPPLFGGFAGCMALDPALDWGDGRVRELLASGLELGAMAKLSPCLFLYSKAWAVGGEGQFAAVRRASLSGKLGARSTVAVMAKSAHASFADTPLLLPRWLPVWLLRAVGSRYGDEPENVMHDVRREAVDWLRRAACVTPKMESTTQCGEAGPVADKEGRPAGLADKAGAALDAGVTLAAQAMTLPVKCVDPVSWVEALWHLGVLAPSAVFVVLPVIVGIYLGR